MRWPWKKPVMQRAEVVRTEFKTSDKLALNVEEGKGEKDTKKDKKDKKKKGKDGKGKDGKEYGSVPESEHEYDGDVPFVNFGYKPVDEYKECLCCGASLCICCVENDTIMGISDGYNKGEQGDEVIIYGSSDGELKVCDYGPVTDRIRRNLMIHIIVGVLIGAFLVFGTLVSHYCDDFLFFEEDTDCGDSDSDFDGPTFMTLPLYFWLTQLFLLFFGNMIIRALLMCCGLSHEILCQYYVNYVRKLHQMVESLFILLANIIMEYTLEGFNAEDIWIVLWSGWIWLFLKYVFLSQPVREKVPFFMKEFQAIDRPEDRPYTLFWLHTEGVALWTVIFLLIFVADNRQYITAVLIGIFADGIAEPVGIAFGKHKHRVKAFMVDRWYWRSYEGSAAVYLVSIAAVVGGSIWTRVLSDVAIWMAVLFVPPVATFAEAVSPHTWDNAAIVGSSGIMLQLIDLIWR